MEIRLPEVAPFFCSFLTSVINFLLEERMHIYIYIIFIYRPTYIFLPPQACIGQTFSSVLFRRSWCTAAWCIAAWGIAAWSFFFFGFHFQIWKEMFSPVWAGWKEFSSLVQRRVGVGNISFQICKWNPKTKKLQAAMPQAAVHQAAVHQDLLKRTDENVRPQQACWSKKM